jgi:hypothetical protein
MNTARPDAARPEAVATEAPAQARDRIRDDNVPVRYSGWLHFAFTSLGSLAVIVLCATQVTDPRWYHFVTFPVTLLFANAAEYFAHRGPMHRPRRMLKILYRRHALVHHRFFHGTHMQADSARDFYLVLFPPVMLFFFLGVVAMPIALMLFVLVSTTVGWLYAMAAMSYFLTYEWLHFAYHQPPNSWVGRLPGMALLRRHHQLHHDPRLMGRYNFNITFPICDALFGTRYLERPDRSPPEVALRTGL